MELVREAAWQTHQFARSATDRRYEGLRVKLTDGTKIIVPRTDETVKAYAPGSGRTGSAYFPQIHASGFLDLAEHFLLAAIFPRHGQKAGLVRFLQAMRNGWFLYDPWRIRPRICQFPPSVFVRQKSTAAQEEFAKCMAIQEDMHLLGIKYGQIEP